jgi:ATP-dependent exoDNAse (exonuclease V) beta subunit
MNESGHYYDLKGKAVFEVPNKTKGGYRKTTLRDAKGLGLLPSVTTIFKCLASPELDRWKQQQVLMASLTLPRHQDESDEEYCSRIMQDAFKQVDDAADLGTNIHKALENHFQGEPYDPVMECYVEPVKKWVEKNNVTFLQHELRLVSPEVGYAGTTDALIMKDGVLHILDYKSRKTKPDFDIKPWAKEPMQIAAYAKVAGAVRGVNLYISTTEPGRIGEAWYDEKTLNENYEAFTHICKYWQFSTGYQPPKK